jgi:cell division protein FtsZ
VSSPLLEESIDGAQGVLLSIAGGSDLGLFEINEAAAMVSDAVHDDANIIFGATIDDALGDEVRVTVIAAGFEGGRPKRREEAPSLRRPAPAKPAQTQEETRAAAKALAEERRHGSDLPGRKEPVPVGAATPAPGRKAPSFDDDLDVPDFLK